MHQSDARGSLWNFRWNRLGYGKAGFRCKNLQYLWNGARSRQSVLSIALHISVKMLFIWSQKILEISLTCSIAQLPSDSTVFLLLLTNTVLFSLRFRTGGSIWRRWRENTSTYWDISFPSTVCGKYSWYVRYVQEVSMCYWCSVCLTCCWDETTVSAVALWWTCFSWFLCCFFLTRVAPCALGAVE